MIRRLAVVAFVALGLLAAVQSAAAAAAEKYSPASVTSAFQSRGIKLADATQGSATPVKIFTSVKATDGWRVGIYVYPNETGATAAFKANAKSWQQSGMAAARAGNVVIAVVPNGHSLKKKAKRWAMPALVAAAIRAFSK
jgi:dihydroxyacetone kinase